MHNYENVEALLDDWNKFLREVFGVSLPSKNMLATPKSCVGFNWGVVSPKGITIEKTINSYSGICPVWRWTNDNLDSIVGSIRSTKRGAWVIRCRNGTEPDKKHKNKSSNDIWTAGINTLTLSERLLLGRWYFWKTNGQQLDTENITRCDGSRDARGYAPDVYFRWHHVFLLSFYCISGVFLGLPNDRYLGLGCRS